MAVLLYVIMMRISLVIVSLDNLAICQKYGFIVGAGVRLILRRMLARASLLIFVNDGARANFVWPVEPPNACGA